MNYILNYQTWKRLFEQAKPETSSTDAETSPYGKYEFGQTFVANYTQPDKRKEEYKTEIKKMIDDFKAAITKGKKLVDIRLTIRSSASAKPATNGYSLEKPPAHDFEGLLPKTGWVKTGAKGYVVIEDGNEFLAKNRGEETKNAIVADLKEAGIDIPEGNIKVLGREDGKWVSDSEETKEQYVKVIVEGLFEEIPPIPKPSPTKYPYALTINTYEIDGNPDFVRLKEEALFASSSIYDVDAKVTNPLAKKMTVAEAEAKAKTDFANYAAKFIDDGSVYQLALFLKTNGRRTENSGLDHAFEGFIKIENYAAKENGVYYFNDYNEWLKQSQKGYFGEGGVGSTKTYLAGTKTIAPTAIVDEQPEISDKIRNTNIKNYGVSYRRGIINWKATSSGAEGVGTQGTDSSGKSHTIKEIKGGSLTNLNSLSQKEKGAASLK